MGIKGQQGLKLWGFGYSQSRGFNPETDLEYRRPFIEMWAGVSKEFFTPAQLPANSELQFEEYYTPTVGLTSFTHASEHAVIDLSTDKESYDGNSDLNIMVSLNYFITKPLEPVTLSLQFSGDEHTVTLHEETTTHETIGLFTLEKTIALENLCDDINRLVFELRSENQILMSAQLPLSFTNAGTCATSVYRHPLQRNRIRSCNSASTSRKQYTIKGVFLGEVAGHQIHQVPETGVILSIDNQGKCVRSVEVR